MVPVDPGYAVSGAQPDVARTVLPDAGDVVAGKSVRHAQRAVFRTFYIHDPFVVAAEPDSLLGVFENIDAMAADGRGLGRRHFHGRNGHGLRIDGVNVVPECGKEQPAVGKQVDFGDVAGIYLFQRSGEGAVSEQEQSAGQSEPDISGPVFRDRRGPDSPVRNRVQHGDLAVAVVCCHRELFRAGDPQPVPGVDEELFDQIVRFEYRGVRGVVSSDRAVLAVKPEPPVARSHPQVPVFVLDDPRGENILEGAVDLVVEIEKAVLGIDHGEAVVERPDPYVVLPIDVTAQGFARMERFRIFGRVLLEGLAESVVEEYSVGRGPDQVFERSDLPDEVDVSLVQGRIRRQNGRCLQEGRLSPDRKG